MFLTACCIKQKVPSITRSRAPPSKNGRTSSIIIPLPSAPLQLVHDTLCTDPWMGELFLLFPLTNLLTRTSTMRRKLFQHHKEKRKRERKLHDQNSTTLTSATTEKNPLKVCTLVLRLRMLPFSDTMISATVPTNSALPHRLREGGTFLYQQGFCFVDGLITLPTTAPAF